MKIIVKIISLIFLLTVAISCSKDDGKDKPANIETYINFSVAGNSKNGTFNISGNDIGNSDLNYNGIVVAGNGEGSALVDFQDLSQLIGVGLVVPAATGVVEITDTNPYGYDVGFGFEDISLDAKAISVNISEIEFDGILLLHIKGTFTGTAAHQTHDSNSGEEIEIPHLVDGEFQYYSPAYNP